MGAKTCAVCSVSVPSGTKRRPRKYCSVKCAQVGSVKHKETQCLWCGGNVGRKHRENIHCSNECRYRKANFVRWMRDKQQRYKGRLEPLHQGYTSWHGWAANTARQAHRHEELTSELLWNERCNTMANINRYRVANTQRNTQRICKEKTWEDAVSGMSTCPTHKSLKWKWTQKIQNMASNQKKRIRRKAEMKRCQQETCHS